MLICLRSTSPAQRRTTVLMPAAPPSPSLPVCWLWKKIEHIPSFFSFYHPPPPKKSHLLTTSGARESLSSCVSEHECTSRFPACFLLPASRWRCSAYKQLTASTILWSHDLGHYQIRAITCCNSSLHTSLYIHIGGVYLPVIMKGVRSEVAELLLTTTRAGLLLLSDSWFGSPREPFALRVTKGAVVASSVCR